MIGRSMISPEGLAIRPRMPASCLICASEPRAPECAIIHTEFTGRPGSDDAMPSIIARDTSSVAPVHTSTTLL